MQLNQTPQCPTRFSIPMLSRLIGTMALMAFVWVSPASFAQGLFSPAITVNQDVVTYYELDQRAQLHRLLRTPGDPIKLARKELVEDRLKKQAVLEAGIQVGTEEILLSTEDFAKRANLSLDEFLAALKEGGVDPETFREFTWINLVWGEYVRSRFLARSRPTEEEIDSALGRLGSGGGIRVLLSEIIIPINPQNAALVEAKAEELSQITSQSAFSEAAAQYSATDTRTRGGRMDWLPITNLPPDFRPLLLALRPGEVTAPIALPNAVALFQMRDIQEIPGGTPSYSAIEFAKYYIAGGRSEEGLKAAAKITNYVDTCDDLYGFAKGQPIDVLDIESLPPKDIPRDVAIELAKLDEGEISLRLTSSNGQTLILLMLCGRTPAIGGDEDVRADLINGLIEQRLKAFSDSYVDQLRADALIIEK